MTDEESRALGRLEGKVDLLIDMHHDYAVRATAERAESRERIEVLEDWRGEVENKYAFGKGALASFTAIAGALGGLATWFLSQLTGHS